MSKGNRRYIIILTICFVGLILLQVLSPKPIDWRLSYMKKDKVPYGTSALHDALSGIFPVQSINIKNVPVYNSLKGNEINNCNYIFINQSFSPDKLDTRELLNFVGRGNNVFIAANYFSGKLADTLKIKTDNFFIYGSGISTDSAGLSNIYTPHDSIKINFVNPELKSKTDYVYKRGIENIYFNSFDTTKTTVLGKNSSGNINFIQIKFGKGKLFVSSLPEVFSNYHFVSERNSDYVYKALSYLPNQQIIWDEYYKVGNVHQDSPMRVIFNNPALLTAYYLLMLSLIIYMIIGAKRKQRVIPVIEPLRNTTLDFVDIVGTLYYQAGNHKNLADKKITFFLEYIRTSFQVKTTLYDDTFIERISNLSGIDKQKVHDLFYYFSDITFKQSITQQQLLKLNRMIEDFYNENKR